MKLKYLKKEHVAEDTMAFYFMPQKNISWLPGQFFYYTLPGLKYPDPKGATRMFTLFHSPTEGNTLGFTTRMRKDSGFKNTLKEMTPGTIIEGEGPEGTFILDEAESGHHVLLAGGIGITPFRSFIKYNIDKGLESTNIRLIYSNSTPEQIAFHDELAQWARENKNLKVDFTITNPETSKRWKGERGRIDAVMIKKLLTQQELENAIFWVCGPPAMVRAMEDVLGKINIPSNRVRAEKFTGY